MLEEKAEAFFVRRGMWSSLSPIMKKGARTQLGPTRLVREQA